MIILFILILGAIFASFVSTAAYRIPRGISIILPFSECGNCNTRLKPYELIPVFSYIFLGGKCRYCKQRIPFRYFFAEIILPVTWFFIYLKYGFSILGYIFYANSLILLYLSLIDVDTGFVAIWEILMVYLTGVLYIFCLVMGYLPGFLWESLKAVIVGVGVVLLSYGIVYLIKRRIPMGGGDLLLLPGLSIFLSIEKVLMMLVITGVLGITISTFLLISGKAKREQKFPFIPFLSAGFFLEVLIF